MRPNESTETTRRILIGLVLAFLLICSRDAWSYDGVDFTGYDGITFEPIVIDEIDCGE